MKKKVIIIRTLLTSVWLIMLILSFYCLGNIIYVPAAYFVYGKLNLPVMISVFLFSLVKSLVLIISVCRNDDISDNIGYFKWQKGLSKPSKIILISLLTFLIIGNILNLCFIRQGTAPEAKNLSFSSFAEYPSQDNETLMMKHGKTRLYTKSTYEKTETDEGFWFDYILLYDAPKWMLNQMDNYYSNERIKTKSTVLNDYKGINEIKYYENDEYFICILKNDQSFAYVRVDSSSDLNISIKENAVDILVDAFLAKE